MNPIDWEGKRREDIVESEAWKPFRNQSALLHGSYIIGGIAVAFSSLIGFYFVTGTWEESVVNAESTQSDALITIVAITFTWFTVNLYIVLGYAIPAGGPFLNFIYSIVMAWGAWLFTGAIFSNTSVLLPIGLEFFPFGPMAKYHIIGTVIAILPWLIFIVRSSFLRQRNPERVRKFEQRYMPFPLFDDYNESDQ